MNKSDLVREFCEENIMPVQKLCPIIVQYIRLRDKIEAWDSGTCERKEVFFNPTNWTTARDFRDKGKILVSVRNYYEGLYVRYVEELDALEIAKVHMYGRRGQNGVAMIWHYDDRLFIFHNDSDAYLPDGTVYAGGKYYSKMALNIINGWHLDIVSKESYKELRKFDPKVNIDAMIDYNTNGMLYTWMLARWYQMHFMARDKSKLYDVLSSYELSEMYIPYSAESLAKIYFEKLDDNYVVLRGFYSGEEFCRLFISAKGKPTLMVNDGGDWRIKSSTPWRMTQKSELVNADKMVEFTPLKYILPCIDMEKVSIQSFINILRHPIIEQLYKAGYPYLSKAIARNAEVGANLKEYFGVEKERKLPLYKLLGVNKFVLNVAEQYNNIRIVKEIKYFIGNFDATKVSEDLCKDIADYIGGGSWNYNRLVDLVVDDRYRYTRRNYSLPLTDEEKKWILRLFRMEKSRNGCIELYNDAIRSYYRLNNKPDIDFYNFHSYDEILRFHDAIVALGVAEAERIRTVYAERDRQAAERREKIFAKLQEERVNKFEYENDEFCIRVPHTLSEITTEGVVLHHCVGGYLDKHANGYTNILFLRRKGEENRPFYTIEIDANDKVVQIHGCYNRWLGNNPEAVPFVYTYLKRLGAKFSTNILLNKATGYAPSDDMLDNSYLKEIV